jgi:hypothetical protein
MSKPLEDWDEDDVLALPSGESDGFERKGSKLLDLTLPGVQEGDVLNELAKQLSAFSNTGGGRIFYGVADNGTVDSGGVAMSVKGRQSTKEWLEDVIPTLTEFEIVGFNVYEIGPKPTNSKIAAGKVLCVVDVPDSDRAPHQSARDLKYYVRLGGKSHPARHRMIEDIRNRQKHPALELSGIKLEVVELPLFVPTREPPKFAGDFRIRFRINLKNIGRVMAKNTCLRLQSSTTLRWDNYDNGVVRRRGVHSVAVFWEFCDPVYPGMEIGFWVDAVGSGGFESARVDRPWGGPWYIEGRESSEIRLSWSLFADNAPVREGSTTVKDLGFERAAAEAVLKRPDASKISYAFPGITRSY